MSFAEMRLAVQLIAEETLGAPSRRRVYAAKAEEDAAVGAVADQVRRVKR